MQKVLKKKDLERFQKQPSKISGIVPSDHTYHVSGSQSGRCGRDDHSRK